MFELQLADELVERLEARDGRYHPQAYLFVLAGLEYCQQHRPTRGHIAGDELAWACRDFAREQFGLTAGTVLRHWGIDSTGDLGRIVYSLIDLGLLIGQPQDRVGDFDGVYEFAEAFEGDYPWSGVSHAAGGR